MAVIHLQKEPKTRSQARKFKKIEKELKRAADKDKDKKSKNIILKSEQLDKINKTIKENETYIKGS